MKGMDFIRALTISVSALSFAAAHAYAEEKNVEDLPVNELLNLSLEQLSNIEVTSVSKKAEKASEAAAAVFVITDDDIRRIGATSIPEALRIAPGVDVARSGAHDWAVSIRGFNGQFANKLLVMIDGRTVYTPIFSGVWWDTLDTVLEDIERIEVIRGPGGTLWGANTVNGIINIITKNAKNTQGGLATFTKGNQEDGTVASRYGVKFGENNYARAYAKYTSRDSEFTTTGQDAFDSSKNRQAGFRSDLNPTERDSITLQGDVYTSREDAVVNLPSLVTPPVQTINDNIEARGGNILAKWTHAVSDDSSLSLQMFYDNARRRHAYYRNDIDTLDFDLQYNMRPHERHEVVLGTGYRSVWNYIYDTSYYSQVPRNRQDNLFSAFIQDKIALAPDEFFLTLGSKFEHNDYTGFEVQPNARLTWLINDKQMMWSAVSRAVRTPSLFTDDARFKVSSFTTPFAGFTESTNNRALDSEELIAYEVGYRIKPVDSVYIDATAFYNNYDKLFENTVGTPFLETTQQLAPYFSAPLPVANGNSAKSHGFELSANWEAASFWQLAASYSYINLKFDHPFIGFTFDKTNPQQQINLRSTLLLPHDIELNNMLYFTDQLRGVSVPDYIRFDTRIAWKPVNNVELSIVGQNLLDDRHPEFSGFIFQNNAEIGRSVYANIRLNF